MGFKINMEATANNTGDFAKEELFVSEGKHCAVFCYYAELGTHVPMFKGSPALYDKGRKAGQEKPPEFIFKLLAETCCEHTSDRPLMLLQRQYDEIKLPAYMFDDPSKVTKKTSYYKRCQKLGIATGTTDPNLVGDLSSYLGKYAVFNVTNTPRIGDGVPEGMMNYGAKFDEVEPCEVMAPTGPNGSLVPVANYKDIQWLDKVPTLSHVCFEWNNPTPDAWKDLYPWHRTKAKESLSFLGSPLERMLVDNPDLAELDGVVPNEDTEAITTTATEITTPPPVEPVTTPDQEPTQQDDAAAISPAMAMLLEQKRVAEARLAASGKPGSDTATA